MLIVGPLAPFFWTEVVGCALRCRRCASCRGSARSPFIVAASLLAIVGIFCKRVQLLVGGFQIPNIDYGRPPDALYRDRLGNPVWRAPTRAWSTSRRRSSSAWRWAWWALGALAFAGRA